MLKRKCYYIQIVLIMFISALFFGCSLLKLDIGKEKIKLSEEDIAFCEQRESDEDELPVLKAKLSELKMKPLYEFSPQEIDLYLSYLYTIEPNVRNRIAHLARKNIGQSYNIYLLGEFPFEIYDADPLFSLANSDCVVFSEHMYAMAFAHDWQSFFALLQRIRYRNGQISTLARNHFTDIDWDINNSWLIEDITEEIAGDKVVGMTARTGRRRFFKKYGIGQDLEETTIETSYIPLDVIPEVVDKLNDGDFVNVIRGFRKGEWCGHVGLITTNADGTVNFLHSTPPKVKEQPILDYVEKNKKYNQEKIEWNKMVDELNKKPKKEKKWWQFWMKEKEPLKKRALLYGFRFFRLRENALENLKELDGEDAPVVTGPLGLLKKYPVRK